ncbi:sialic acid-binding Ig-like lectin 14 [Aquarana catesbeiana]|uniref:sialic acid-binding Ig-like lectin 14 n=1 Tax=Aquarana catesbeiana TaxID=8400 RepID=UPI003CC9B1CB
MKVKRSSFHLSYYHILIYIITHLWSGIDSESSPGYSIYAPRNVTVQRGLCVYIPCNFTVPTTLTIKALGSWNKNKNIEASKKPKNNGRFFLIGDTWRGDCSLYIENPLYEDEDNYHFRVEEDKLKFSYQDIQPYVAVTDLTNKPEISPIKSWLDGEEVTLRCTSPGTCLSINPQITWEGNIQNRSVENKNETHKNGTKTHFSTITFTARKEQNNSTLSCTVHLKGGLTTAQQITMKIESQALPKAFPAAAIYSGCIAAVVIVIVTGVLIILLYRKRKIKENKEASRQIHADVVDHIYVNSEMYSNGPQEFGKIPQQDQQPLSEDGSVHLNFQNLQYMSIDFSKLKPTVTNTDTEEIEYSVVKYTN